MPDIAIVLNIMRRRGAIPCVMRIIGGDFRRRVLISPDDRSPARPMPDLVKESLFNLLRGHTEGVSVIDAFAGSGAVGLEAISRGASRCVFIERDKGTMGVLRQNIEALGVADRAEPVMGDALSTAVLARCPNPVHLVFFDPPYAMVRDPAQWPRVAGQFARLVSMLDAQGYAVLRTPWPCEHERPEGEARGGAGPAIDLAIPGAVGPETHPYGSTAIHLYMKAAPA